MINKFNIAKALLDNAQAVSDSNSLLLIPNGEKHEPDPNQTYITEHIIYGDDDSIGLADNSSDFQFPVYQINVNTPKAEEGGKWRGLQIAGIYEAGFSRGLQLTFGGQMLRARSASLMAMEQMDTHFTHILSIEFSVIN